MLIKFKRLTKVNFKFVNISGHTAIQHKSQNQSSKRGLK